MTVTAKNTRVQYTGNGLVATYAYDWKILDQADLVVITTDLLGADTTLVLGVGYTVTGAGNDSGGNVVLTNSLATGQLLTVYVDMDIDQPTDLTNQQSPFLERIESALDRQALVSQQLAEKLGRCIQLKPTSTDSSGDLQELLESVGTNATVAAASAAAATTQAGLANTARIAAEAAVASIPTTFGAFGLTLAETTTASNARAALELGSAATLTAGTAANNVVQLNASGKIPDVAYLNAPQAWAQQQFAALVYRTGESGAQAVDLNLHQLLFIGAAGALTISDPENIAAGKTCVLLLYSAAAQTISWGTAWHGTSLVSLPTALSAGKLLIISTLCVTTTAGTYMVPVGMVQEA